MNAIPLSLAKETRSPARAGHPLRAVTSVAVLAALGMGLGYARDAALAAHFGATQTTDAFFAASLVPNMIATVIVSGALAPALLPVFTSVLEQRATAFALANTILTLALCVLVPVTVVLGLGAPVVITNLAPGLSLTTAALAAQLVTISAPMIILLGTSALLGTAANALGSFRVPALSPVLVNGTAFVLILIGGREWGIQAAALGLVLGALVQLAVQGASLYRQGWRFTLAFDLADRAVRRVVKLFVPLALFVALAQIVPLIERIISSQFPAGQLSQLAYANKLFQIPGVVLSGSLAVVLFPRLAAHAPVLTRHLLERTEPFWHELLTGMRLGVFITLPFTIALIFGAEPFVQLTLQRGEFLKTDTQTTARLLQLYSIAIVPAGLLLVLTRAFHALRDTVTPLALGLVNTIIYVGGALVLAALFGVYGLPLAFAVSQLTGSVIFAVLLTRRLHVSPGAWLDRELVLSGIAGVIMALSLLILVVVFEPWTRNGSLASTIVTLALVVSSSIIYLLAARWLRVELAARVIGYVRAPFQKGLE